MKKSFLIDLFGILLFGTMLFFSTDAAWAAELNDGNAVSGSLAANGQVEFTFNAEAGDLINLFVVDDQSYTGAYFKIVVYNPDGSEFFSENTQYTPGSYDLKPLQNGTYRVLYFSTGDYTCNYTLYFYNLGEAERSGEDGLIALSDGDVVESSLTPYDVDSFSFEAQAGDLVNLFVVDDQSYTGAYFKIVVYNPDGSEFFNENTQYTPGSYDLKPLQDGTYRVLYSSTTGSPGHTCNYTLYFHNLGAAERSGEDGLIALSDGDVVESSLTPYDVDSFSFEAQAGDLINLFVVDNQYYTGAYFKIVVYNPDGSEFFSENTQYTPGSYDLKPLQDGTYRVLYSSTTGSPGHTCNYTLYFHNLGAAERSGEDGLIALSDGDAVESSLTPYDVDSFSFEAQAGDLINLFVVDNQYYTGAYFKIVVYNPDGSEFFSENTQYTPGSYNLKPLQDGTYRVLYSSTTGSPGHTCNYTLYFYNLGEIERSSQGLPRLLPNINLSSEIETCFDMDGFNFRGFAGESVSFVFKDSFTNSYDDLEIEIHAPDGSVLLSRSGSNGFTTPSVTLPATSGSYRVIVRGDGSGTGPYEVEYINANAANWPRPYVATAPSDLNFSEDASQATAAIDFKAVFNDPDHTTAQLTYTLASALPQEIVELDLSPDGILDITPLPQAFGTVTVKVKAEDPDGLQGQCTFLINVQAVPDRPVTPDHFNFQAGEDQQIGFSLGIPDVSDNDPGETFLWQIQAGNENGLFSIDSATGELQLAGYVDFESLAHHTLTLQVTDSDGLSTSTTVNITITDANDRPVCEDLEFTCNEDLPALEIGADQGILSTVTDPNGDALSVNPLHAVAPSGAILDVRSDGSFSYDASSAQGLLAGESLTDEVTLTVRDIHGLETLTRLSLVLQGENDQPSAIHLSSTNLPPTAPSGWVVGYLTTVDPDEGDQYLYLIEQGDSEWFVIHGNQLILAKEYPPGGPTPLEIQISSTDAVGARITEEFTISSQGTVLPGYARYVKAVGQMVYASGQDSDYQEYFQIIDVTTPEAPQIKSTTDSGFCGSYLSVVDQTAYVGKAAIDISDPTNPQDLGHIGNKGGECYGAVDVVGEIAYALNTSFQTPGNPYLWVVDASDFSSPDNIASISIRNYGYRISVINHTAYIIDEDGIVMIDVSTPSAPSTVGSFSTPGDAMDIDVTGDIACVADGNEGLQIVDLTRRNSPRIISTVNTPGTATRVKIVDNRAFVADGESGVQIIDIQDPFFPKITGSIDTPENALDVDVLAETAYIACGTSGLIVMPLPQPDPDLSVEFSNNIPDPVNGASQVTITANVTGDLDIAAVEFFMDHTGAQGTGLSMPPTDGAFDGKTEEVSAVYTIPDNWTSGRHTVYARARDTSGVWHDFSEYTLIHTPPGMGTLLVPQAYATIQAAVNAANNGDMIIVSPGEYNENIDIDKEISVIGRDHRKTVIYGEGDHRGFYVRADNVTISGFTLNNCESQGIRMMMASHCHIDTVTINNVVGYWKSPGHGIYLIDSSDNTLENLNIAHVKGASSWTAYAGYGIKFENSSNNLIKNCTISEITCGTGLYGSLGPAYGIHLSNSDHVTVSGTRIDYIRNREQLRAVNCSGLQVQGCTLDGIYLEGSTTATIGGAPDATNHISLLENHTGNPINAAYNNWDSTSPDDGNIVDQLDDESLGRVNSDHWIYDYPPAFTSTPGSLAVLNHLFTYEISASDPDGDPLEFKAENLPDWLSLINTYDNGAILSGTPSGNMDQAYEITLSVMTVGAGNKSETQSFTLRVIPNISFTDLPLTRTYAGKAYSGIIATDLVIDSAPTVISVTGQPEWLGFVDNGDGTGVLSGTPPANGVGQSWTLAVRVDSGSNFLELEIDQGIFAMDGAGLWNIAGAVHDVAVKNDMAFAVCDRGIYVIGGSDGQDPVIVGRYLGGGGSQVAVSGNTLVMGKENILSIINISDSGAPRLIKNWDIGISIDQLRLENELVYALSSQSTSLKIIDISDPLNVFLRSGLDLGSGAQWSRIDDFDVKDDMLYVVDGYDIGLQVIDVSDPDNPARKPGWFGMWDGTPAVDASDAYLYTSMGGTLYVLDKEGFSHDEWENPWDAPPPEPLGSILLSNHSQPCWIDVKNSMAYLASGETGVEIIDVTDPRAPLSKQKYLDIEGQLNGVAAGENNVYIAGEKGLYIIPAYKPDAPPVILEQPSNTRVVKGEKVEFSIVVSGTPSLTYQWYKDGFEIENTGNENLVIENAKQSDAGVYTCLVLNDFGVKLSDSFSLYVLVPGDVSGSSGVELSDALMALQVMAGKTPSAPVHISGDVNADGKIGMEEALYVLDRIKE